MTEGKQTWIKAGLLIGLAIFLLVKILTGTLYFYINQRFLWLVALGALIFFLLGLAILRQRPGAHSHDHHDHGDGHHHHHHDEEHAHSHEHGATSWGLVVVAIPLLLGFLVPAKPLDGSALGTRGISANTALSLDSASQSEELARPADERNVLDWVRAFNYASDPGVYAGETADVIGFVYHDDRLAEDQFLVSRFTVTCCVADAFAVGLIVESDEAGHWPGNAWVHVVGTVEVGSLDGQPAPLIRAESITAVAVPPQPYLFP